MGATRKPVSFYNGCAVSIHAPVMGATNSVVCDGLSEIVSIHAPVMGATFKPARNITSVKFQSTRP